MKLAARSKCVGGMLFCALLLGCVFSAFGQMRSAMTGPAAIADAGIKIRKLAPVKELTPAFKTDRSNSPNRGKDWWCARVEFETAADWTDELELTTYVYVEDKSNKDAPVMYRSVVTYVNLEKGKHLSDAFLHPDTFKRVGMPKFVAVVVKAGGRVIASESTAQKPNWWDSFSPVDGVLLHRGQTPFAVIDFDYYPCIKPVVAGR